MNGIFRYSKSIAASMALALLAFGIRYGQSCLFRSVDDDGSDVVFTDTFARAPFSLSPQRTTDEPTTATWNIAVATNRVFSSTNERSIHAVSDRSQQSLTDQVKATRYATPQTVHGFTNVSVPLNRIRGMCPLSPTDAPSISLGTFTESSSNHFYNRIKDTVDTAASRDILIFVHGFNVSLNDATARAAQIAEDIPYHGTIVVFSWQSAGRTEAYLSDEKTAERYFWNLAELMAGLRKACGEETRLHVLAHSMGNRVTLKAISALCGRIDPAGRQDPLAFAKFFDQPGSTYSNASFRSVVTVSPAEVKERFPDWGSWRPQNPSVPQLQTLIMAAPDVDAQEFTATLEGIRPVCRRMILYASDTDYALEASRKVHGGDFRAGDSRANLQIDGLRIVGVSGVSSADKLGHSYYGSEPRVLDQLAGLLRPPLK